MATLSDLYTHLKTLCEQWFYNKSTIDQQMNTKVDKIIGKGLSTNDYTTAEKNKLANIESEANKTIVDSALSGSSENPVQNKVINTALNGKVDKVNGKGLSANDFTSAYKTKLDNLDTNLTSKNVTVEKLSTAETGFLSSYIVKQNGVQVGNTINIPKDYLVKSGSVKTVTTADVPVQGYVVGDKYIDLVINTKTSDGTNEHLYILVSDLISDSIDWDNIQNKPSTYPPSSHQHIAVLDSTDTGGLYVRINNQAPIGILAHISNTYSGKSHSHGNITSLGQITTTGTSGGNMVVTNSSNKIVVDTTINVIDNLIQDLITYGSS